MDGFDCLPDHLIMLIFNYVADAKALTRCRSVSKRFNSLVPHTCSLHLSVDCVISSDSVLLTFLKSLLKSLHHLLFNSADPTRTLNCPAQVLSGFRRIRHLQIELPAGDLRLNDGVAIKWRAEFGKTLRSCVIFGFRTAASGGVESGVESDCSEGMKTRVVWTISALIAASARHYLLREVVREHEEMERLVLKDRDGEGTVVMDREGLRECRMALTAARGDGVEENKTVLPSVGMRMRHLEGGLSLSSGEWVEGATLVVVRPPPVGEGGTDVEDAELALGAFGSGVYGEVVQLLLKRSKVYSIEMNPL